MQPSASNLHFLSVLADVWGLVREKVFYFIKIEKKIFLLLDTSSISLFNQFLPDDDEAASMFTVVIDKEIAQLEKKKKTTTTGRV